ncbi:hypothetical protein E2C01_055533 [Portunus trituberculatus]|uniref:Uncharacterized protein n=1 Tax=Portunus trituberculatus TaxID=210409 RepID=A0A5B7GMZ2_PORTR|nr:hypothetical protein [Portunus trituberculatus]
MYINPPNIFVTCFRARKSSCITAIKLKVPVIFFCVSFRVLPVTLPPTTTVLHMTGVTGNPR